MNKRKGVNTICTHIGEVKDDRYKGAISPLYMATSYAFDDIDELIRFSVGIEEIEDLTDDIEQAIRQVKNKTIFAK